MRKKLIHKFDHSLLIWSGTIFFVILGVGVSNLTDDWFVKLAPVAGAISGQIYFRFVVRNDLRLGYIFDNLLKEKDPETYEILNPGE